MLEMGLAEPQARQALLATDNHIERALHYCYTAEAGAGAEGEAEGESESEAEAGAEVGAGAVAKAESRPEGGVAPNAGKCVTGGSFIFFHTN